MQIYLTYLRRKRGIESGAMRIINYQLSIALLRKVDTKNDDNT